MKFCRVTHYIDCIQAHVTKCKVADTFSCWVRVLKEFNDPSIDAFVDKLECGNNDYTQDDM